jgi:hypothetical protein
MTTEATDETHVRIDTNGRVRHIPKNEPVFLIRAQDVCSEKIVRMWADMAKSEGADQDIVDAARQLADQMAKWPKKKIPDLPRQYAKSAEGSVGKDNRNPTQPSDKDWYR